ncbi:MAG: hypothetical protein LBM08_14760, partial [Dysgonamonadaceae bacterium]|nr:hypothetical protein [Dysgonamonadaceae bacterium]
MKRLLFLFMAISCNITACNTDDKTTPEEAGNNSVSDVKNLIVYYSWSGNSRKIATELQSILNCDIVEITPETPYTTDYNTMLNVAQSEISAIDASGSYPAITNNVDDIGDYDAVFLCYPLWWSRMATPAQAFLHKHRNKLEGKTIALVCTSGSSGIDG